MDPDEDIPSSSIMTTSNNVSMVVLHKKNVCGDKERVGRWSQEEHEVFLEGLDCYGKQWKLIAGFIGTRTVVQVRTHAQKYFQKVERQSSTTTTGNSTITVKTSSVKDLVTKSKKNANGGGVPKKKKTVGHKNSRKLRITTGKQHEPKKTSGTGSDIVMPTAVTSVPNPFLDLYVHFYIFLI